MENGYESLKYSDDEKVLTYFKLVVKAVKMTHDIDIMSEMKSKELKEAIESKNKTLMLNTLQKYIHKYKDYINKTNKMCVYNVSIESYNNITLIELENQLQIMIGIVYDCEAKHCIAHMTIKECLKKLLKESGIYTKKEIDYFLL